MIINVNDINSQLAIKKKAIAVFGCSWAAGQGAYDDTVETYPSKIIHARRAFLLDDTYVKQPGESWSEEKNGFYFEDSFVQENKNSFISVLAKEYLNDEFVPLNFGLPGCGNSASIRYAEMVGINWDLVETLHIIFIPTDASRGYWPVVDENNRFYHWTLWPNTLKENGGVKGLANYYSSFNNLYAKTYIEKRALTDLYFYTKHLAWMAKSFKDSKFLILPAFTAIKKQIFAKEMNTAYNALEKKTKLLHKQPSKYMTLVNDYPWDCFITPNGAETFAEFILMNEDKEWSPFNYVDVVEKKGTPNGFLTVCAHPSRKSHKMLAEWIYKNEFS